MIDKPLPTDDDVHALGNLLAVLDLWNRREKRYHCITRGDPYTLKCGVTVFEPGIMMDFSISMIAPRVVEIYLRDSMPTNTEAFFGKFRADAFDEILDTFEGLMGGNLPPVIQSA